MFVTSPKTPVAETHNLNDGLKDIIASGRGGGSPADLLKASDLLKAQMWGAVGDKDPI